MEYQKYQHVERIGTAAVRNLLEGRCYIFPKLDGTNASTWRGKEVCAGSRRRELDATKDGDNAGFYKWIQEQDNIHEFFEWNHKLRLFGEWLVPHTVKDYVETAWRKFYVFDVMDENGNYLSYEDYAPLMGQYGIDYLKPIQIIDCPTLEQLEILMNTNTFLMQPDCIGEGLVIKRYDFKNQFGHVCWGKMVHAEFKAKHVNEFGAGIPKALIENQIVDKYITKALVEKEFAKILVDVEATEWDMRYTTRLLNTVFHCLVDEEAWNFVKKFKNPVIDFNRLMFVCSAKTKSFLPEYYPNK